MRILLTLSILLGCTILHAQPDIQQLNKDQEADMWLFDPPFTLLIIDSDGGSTQHNAFGEVTSTNVYGILQRMPCYFITDMYSSYALKLGPQRYMLIGGYLYSFSDNKINPNCVKYNHWEFLFPPRGSDYMSINTLEFYTRDTPPNFYRLNDKGQKVIKKEVFPDVIQKLFEEFPDYYDRYSPFCKEANLNDPVYASMLVEALIRYNNPELSYLTPFLGYLEYVIFKEQKIVFSAHGFKAKSGKSTFQVINDNRPLEPVIPADAENDELKWYGDRKTGRYYSSNYLKQVEETPKIPKDGSGVQFNGEPCLLTDFYGFPAVFDDEKMYYFEN